MQIIAMFKYHIDRIVHIKSKLKSCSIMQKLYHNYLKNLKKNNIFVTFPRTVLYALIFSNICTEVSFSNM